MYLYRKWHRALQDLCSANSQTEKGAIDRCPTSLDLETAEHPCWQNFQLGFASLRPLSAADLLVILVDLPCSLKPGFVSATCTKSKPSVKVTVFLKDLASDEDCTLPQTGSMSATAALASLTIVCRKAKRSFGFPAHEHTIQPACMSFMSQFLYHEKHQ